MAKYSDCCSKEKSEPDSLIGKWQLAGTYVYYIFNEDMTLETNVLPDVVNGKYLYARNQLAISLNKDHFCLNWVELAGDILLLSMIIPWNGCKFTFARV